MNKIVRCNAMQCTLGTCTLYCTSLKSYVFFRGHCVPVNGFMSRRFVIQHPEHLTTRLFVSFNPNPRGPFRSLTSRGLIAFYGS